MLSRHVLIYLVAMGASTLGAHAESCRDSIGEARSSRLVDRCLEVSTASRPPCNADNACALIEDEIRRGCAGLGDDAPRFCGR